MANKIDDNNKKCKLNEFINTMRPSFFNFHIKRPKWLRDFYTEASQDIFSQDDNPLTEDLPIHTVQPQ